LATLDAADVVVVIGADVERNHLVTGFVLKRSVARGARLVVIDPHETTLEKRACQVLRPAAGADGLVLEAWLKALAPGGPEAEVLAAQAGVSAEAIAQLARIVEAARQPVVVYGKGLTANQPEAVRLLEALARVNVRLRLLCTRGEANSRAAAQMGLDQAFRPAAGQVVYLALGDDYAGKRLAAAVEQAPFLALQASYASRLTERADVVLPVETWVEQSGHFLNLEGRLQPARRALKAPALVRSNLAVLESLAERLGFSLDGDWQTALGAASLTSANPN
jgi:predicted molibdopterin-dependent oxidoreductase YjgC